MKRFKDKLFYRCKLFYRELISNYEPGKVVFLFSSLKRSRSNFYGSVKYFRSFWIAYMEYRTALPFSYGHICLIIQIEFLNYFILNALKILNTIFFDTRVHSGCLQSLQRVFINNILFVWFKWYRYKTRTFILWLIILNICSPHFTYETASLEY